MTSGDPQGKRALFETPVSAPPDVISSGPTEDGRQALFSAAKRRPGTVVVDCSGCGVRTRRSLADVGVRLAMFSMWLPGRTYSRWMRCPECRSRTWCRIGWLD